jgi:hypothetical protein
LEAALEQRRRAEEGEEFRSLRRGWYFGGEEWKRRRWDEDTLAVIRKGDAGKVAIAKRLRKETTVTLGWIAARLKMGVQTHFAHLLYWQRRGIEKKHKTDSAEKPFRLLFWLKRGGRGF